MDDIKELYAEMGYRVYIKVLNSAMFGSATRRERVIIVAVRNDIQGEFIYPKPTHIDAYLKNKYGKEYSEEKKYAPVKTVNM